MTGSRISDEHKRRNETTCQRWDTMAAHRARVMRVISEARGEMGASLCVLGAGNANDLELAQLAREFKRVVLVDLDSDALNRATRQLPDDLLGSVECVADVDLTGLLATLERWTRNDDGPIRESTINSESHRIDVPKYGDDVHDHEIDAAIEQAATAQPPDVGRFDVVASTCLLTQLIDSVVMALPDHPRRLDLLVAVRERHLKIIVEMLNPGGVAILFTDFVSTATAPELADLEESAVPAAAERWIEQRNFFTGANPFVLQAYFLRDPVVSPMVQQTQLIRPWRWDIGAKQFAVCAILVRRKTI